MKRVGVIALASVLATAGCAAQSRDTQSVVDDVKVVDHAGMVSEYHGLADRYPNPLPSGIRFPSGMPAAEEPTMYEVGEGANRADSFWICAWMGEWLKWRRTDAAAAAVAWRWVEAADRTQLHREHYYDPRDVWHQNILEPARAGDVGTFREFYTTSCGYPGLPKITS